MPRGTAQIARTVPAASHSRCTPAAHRTRYAAAPASRRKLRVRDVAGQALVVMLIVALLAAAFFVTRGFNLYREALAATSLDDMAAAIEGDAAFVPLEELPELYLQAVVAVEDRRFYAHPGIDAIACVRALVHDLQAGAIVEGGSTITQQLAKNQYFTQEQTVERKIAEAFMALDMEQRFSKQEILELYVNSIYFGDGLYGIGAAARGCFGTDAASLDACESTLLAGIPNAPSAYALSTNADLARQRQQQVLDKLVDCRYLNEAQARRIAGTCSA